MMKFNTGTIKLILHRAFKYLVEALAIAVAAFYIPNKKMRLSEIIAVAITGAVTFAILDMYAPEVAASVRTGAGFGIGAAQVGFP